MSAARKKNIAKIQSTYVQQQEISSLINIGVRKRLYRRLSLFLVFVVLTSYFMTSNILSQTSTMQAMLVQKKQLDKEYFGLKKQQEILKEDIIKLNDDDYIAKLARKDYYFSNKNEIIFTIPDDKRGSVSNN